MAAAPLTERARRVRRVQDWLLRHGWPRLQMFLLVAITGGVGFLVSAGLLKAGWTVMWQRYLVAIAVAYLAFLALIWLWLQLSRRHLVEETSDPLLNALDAVPLPMPRHGVGDLPNPFESLGEAATSAAGDDPRAWLLVPLLAVLAALALSVAWVIYIAPVLFAELLVDAVLAAGLYRRLRRDAGGSWLATALRHTAIPFACAALLVALAGWGMQEHQPDAKSLGGWFKRVSGRG